MKHRNYLFIWLTLSGTLSHTLYSAVVTGQYNAARTSSTSSEITLNSSNVKVGQFGRLFSWPVDGWVFAQPLYLPGVKIHGASKDLVFVATMHNSIYAFEAGKARSKPLWMINLGPSVPAPTANGCPAASFTGPELGILGTPVIDSSTQTLYVVSASPATAGFVHYLHALDIGTGREKLGAPVQIRASVPGNGYDSVSGQVSLRTSSTDVQRPALLLSHGTVYAAFGNCGPDVDPWHGWIVGYSAANPQVQTFAFNTTPNGGQGGIWQSGRGPVADLLGDIYFNTGNATVYSQRDSQVTTGDSTTDANNDNYAERFIKLTATGQFSASYPPVNYASLNSHDLDFSSSGPLLIPGTNLLITGGKDGVIYLFNSNNLTAPVQQFQATGTAACSYSMDGCDQIHDLAFWNNTLYVWGTNDHLRAYSFNPATGTFNSSPASQNLTYVTGYHSAALAVSANGTLSGSGVLWAITPNSILHAFDAGNVGTELWNSTQNSARDALPSFPRFTEPTIANGRVYVATHSNQVMVYGLLNGFSLSTSPSSTTVLQGGSASATVDVAALGSDDTVTLSLTSGLPAGASAVFSPPTITGSGVSLLTIKTTPGTSTGRYNLIVTGSSPALTRTASVSLVVTTSDTKPPTWTCCTYSSKGSSVVVGLSAQDTQSGLKSIRATQIVNASASTPSFPAGTRSPVSFSATESGWSSYIKFVIQDVAGNSAIVDSCELIASREPGKPIPFTVKNLSPLESSVTILNGSPGVKHLRFSIASGQSPTHIEVTDLKDGEVRHVDLSQFLKVAGDAVTITTLGKPEGSAHVVFASQQPNR